MKLTSVDPNQTKKVTRVALVAMGACCLIGLASCGSASAARFTTTIPIAQKNGVSNQGTPSTQPALTMTTPASSVTTRTPPPATSSTPVTVTQPARGGTVKMSLEPASLAITAGDKFTFDVVVDTTAALGGAQADLKFDPALMKCDGVDEGRFFKDFAATHGMASLLLPSTIDNKKGTVSPLGDALMGGQEPLGATGKGPVFTVRFTALQSGTARPTLSNMLAADPEGKTIDVQ